MNVDWIVIPSFFSADVCNALVQRCAQKEKNFAKVGTNIDGQAQGRIDFEARRSKIAWLNIFDIEEIYNSLMVQIKQVNRTHYNFDISHGISEIQFTEYNSDNYGHYGWHMDVFYRAQNYHDRKLSVSIQLTDPNTYEGGNLEFDKCDPLPTDLSRPLGSVIIFPSFQYHRVTEVTKGTRYSLVTWIEGPKWR